MTTFDDVAGLQDAKRSITEMVIWPMQRPELFTGLRAVPKGASRRGSLGSVPFVSDARTTAPGGGPRPEREVRPPPARYAPLWASGHRQDTHRSRDRVWSGAALSFQKCMPWFEQLVSRPPTSLARTAGRVRARPSSPSLRAFLPVPSLRATFLRGDDASTVDFFRPGAAPRGPRSANGTGVPSRSSLMSKWIGESEKLVRTMFNVAGYKEPSARLPPLLHGGGAPSDRRRTVGRLHRRG